MKKVILFFALAGITAIHSAEAQDYGPWNIGAPLASANVTATLTPSDSTLTITGTGEMRDWNYSLAEYCPWYDFRSNIKRVVIEGITNIGNNAFFRCANLIEISIPNSVTSIGNSALGACTGLTSISLPSSLTSIGNGAFVDCSGLTGVFTIPNTVTSIGNDAFSSCTGLTEISIPDGVTTINNYTFANCRSLTSISLPNTVTSIGNAAFQKCSSLTVITIPSSVTSIGTTAFQNCINLTEINIPNGVTTIANYTFEYCIRLASISIPNGVTSIGDNAFYACSTLTGTLIIPNSVTSIGTQAFYYCKGLTGALTIPNSVTSIGNAAFAACSGFTGTLTIPNSVTSIGTQVFANCAGLTGIIIPNTVTSIGNNAFQKCTGLSSITSLRSTPPTLGTDIFLNLSNDIPVCVSVDNVAAYQEAPGWSSFTNISGCAPTVSGQITFEGSPLAGVTISYEGGSATTATDGTYSTATAGGSSVSLTPTLAGYSFTPSSITFNNLTADTVNNNFTALSYFTSIKVNSLPTFTLTDGEVCDSSTINLMGYISNYSSGTIFEFSTESNFSSLIQEANTAYAINLGNTTPQELPIHVRAVDTVTDCISEVKTLTLTVNPAPALQTITAGLTNGCSDNVITYSIPSQANVSYLWSATGGDIAGLGDEAADSVLWGAANPLAEVQVVYTLTTGSNACSRTATLPVDILQSPTMVTLAPLSGNNETCEDKNGTQIQLEVTVSNGTPSHTVNYSWLPDNGTGFVAVPASDTPYMFWITLPSIGTNYTYIITKITDANGCVFVPGQ